MRLLVVNGNTNAAMTEALSREAARMLPDWAELTTVQVHHGPAYIGSPETVAAAIPAILARFEELSGEGWDAAVLACFGEPGLAEVRARVPFPVVGMAEASVCTALQLGGRYGIVCPGENWRWMLEEQLRALGLWERCDGITTVPLAEDAADRATAADTAADELRARAAPRTIIVGGAALVGVADRLSAQGASTPRYLDSYRAALAQAIALRHASATPSSRG